MAESMLKQLADGAFGIRMTPPPDLVLSSERDSHLELALDRAAGVGYYFRFFPDHWIDHRPDAAEALDRDIARHTQALPEQEPSRRALISIERHELAGSPALTILHRLGRACVMGHTLVTVEGGLFEARWSASDQTTGVRDAALIGEAFAAKPPSSKQEALAVIAAISFDDPIHDARFPQVALTRARAATRWHLRAKLEIAQPAKPWPAGRIRHEQPSCTIGGVIKTEDLVAEVKKIGYLLGECNQAVLASFILQIRQASDILSDGTQDPQKTCDGISIGLGFEVTQAQRGPIGTPAQTSQSCP